MNRYLSAASLKDVHRNISQSLADTFQMMFHLDVFLLPSSLLGDDSEAVSSYIELKNQDADGILTIAVSRSLVEYLCRLMDPGSPVPAPAIVQDIVCEINNIVSNRLKSYLCDNDHIALELSLPRAGLPPKKLKKTSFVSLHFRIREEDCLDLDFSYAPPPQTASVHKAL